MGVDGYRGLSPPPLKKTENKSLLLLLCFSFNLCLMMTIVSLCVTLQRIIMARGIINNINAGNLNVKMAQFLKWWSVTNFVKSK